MKPSKSVVRECGPSRHEMALAAQILLLEKILDGEGVTVDDLAALVADKAKSFDFFDFAYWARGTLVEALRALELGGIIQFLPGVQTLVGSTDTTADYLVAARLDAEPALALLREKCGRIAAAKGRQEQISIFEVAG